MRVGFWSLVTLGLLTGMLGSLLLAWAYISGSISWPFLIGGTLLLNFVMWFFGPFFMEFMQRFFYKIEKISITDLAQRSPASAKIIEQVCEKYKFKIPKIWLVNDQTPTAYTYGSGRYNARLVFSEGIFHYLDEDEAAAVVAHEMGHITRRDFIVMTIASTLIQLLYQISVILNKSKGSGNKKGALAFIGIFAVFFHFIAQYMLMFLSRVREYGADEFAARETGNPNALATALIKIAYGINQQKSNGTKKGRGDIAAAAGALNISDHKASRGLGNVFHQDESDADDNFTLPSADDLFKVMIFDEVSYWARLLEFKSTHPLTGKRIAYLSRLAVEMGQQPFLDMSQLDSYKAQVDMGKLRGNFMKEVFMLYSSWLAILAGAVVAVVSKDVTWFLYGVAGFLLMRTVLIAYKFPKIPAQMTPSTVLEAMQNVYASPVRGIPIALQGTVVGKGQAGAHVSEDLMMQDQTGLVFLNYQGLIPLFSNLHMAFSKFKKLLDQPVAVEGWFFRSIYQRVDIKKLTPQNSELKTIKSYPNYLQVVVCLVMAVIVGVGTFVFQDEIRASQAKTIELKQETDAAQEEAAKSAVIKEVLEQLKAQEATETTPTRTRVRRTE